MKDKSKKITRSSVVEAIFKHKDQDNAVEVLTREEKGIIKTRGIISGEIGRDSIVMETATGKKEIKFDDMLDLGILKVSDLLKIINQQENQVEKMRDSGRRISGLASIY